MFSKKSRVKKKSSKKENKVYVESGQKEFFEEKEQKASGVFIKERIAPDGINPNPLDYMIIEDRGIKGYAMSLYIETLPRDADFAKTFEPLFNYKDVTSKVIIEPVSAAEASKLLDKRIISLETELITAQNSGDRNRARRVKQKMDDAEGWASDVEGGNNCLFRVGFLFTFTDENIDQLRLKVRDFHSLAGEKRIAVCSCYSVHPEAYLEAAPGVRHVNLEKGPIHSATVKKHIMDIFSLACIFNHTDTDFSHEDGIIAGRNMHTGLPFTLNIFAGGQNGYGMVATGDTGVGKSATLKMYGSRFVDFNGIRVVSVDFESRGSRGEYAPAAEQVGGINYTLSAKGKNRLNIFEVHEEIEYDETAQREVTVLHLTDSMANMRRILLHMLLVGKKEPDFSDITTYQSIISSIVQRLFSKRGIVDGEPESLFEEGNLYEGGFIVSGKVRKTLPTMHEFFKDLLITQKENKNPYHERIYSTMVEAYQDFVEDMYYCPYCLKEYSKEEYMKLKGSDGRHRCKECEEGTELIHVHGLRPYFDGHCEVVADNNTPWLNIDISGVPEHDRYLVQLVAMIYLKEGPIKKNSINPNKPGKLIAIVDELHRTFKYKEARELVADVYRTGRKRNVSMWTLTQALKDYYGYPETEAILKQAAVVLIFKQDYLDREFLTEKTVLTPAQVNEVLSLGGEPDDRGEYDDARKGEMCVICNDKVNFVKVDYLKASEAYVVETDMNKMKEVLRNAGGQ